MSGKPPAEAQQDDEPTAHDVLSDALVETEDDEGWVHAREVLDWLAAQGWTLVPLAARPSADTETLRDAVAEALRDVLDRDLHLLSPEAVQVALRPIRAALDGKP